MDGGVTVAVQQLYIQLAGFNCPYLDVSAGERAMIIKDNLGDWGIVVGGWVGFRKGIPGDRSKSNSLVPLYHIISHGEKQGVSVDRRLRNCCKHSCVIVTP